MSRSLSRSSKPGFTGPFKSPILLFLLLFLSVPVLLFTGLKRAHRPKGWNAKPPFVLAMDFHKLFRQ